MTDEAVQVWLVDREHTDKGLVTTVHATPDGERKHVEQFSANRPREVTAAKEVSPDRLTASGDDEVDRFASEVDRVAERNAPDDVL